MMSSLLNPEKPRIVTLSWNTCERRPKCKGCYLRELPKYKPPINETSQESKDEYPTDADAIIDPDNIREYGVDSIFVNINNQMDMKDISMGGWIPGLQYVAIRIPTYLIIPIDIALRSQWFIRSPIIFKRIISINTFRKDHMQLLHRGALQKIPDIPVITEVSFNEKTLRNKRIRDTIARELNELRESSTYKWSIHHVLNYVRTSNTASKIKIGFRLSDLCADIQNSRISRCVTSAIHPDMPKPCSEYELMEYMDGKLVKTGCPYIRRRRQCI